ncbi:MAG: hypothetical protein ACT6FG_00145 [Methanosarcinaceae archaeon]
MSWSIKINSVSIPDFTAIRATDTINGAKQFSVVFAEGREKIGDYSQFQDVEILIGTTVIFKGRVEQIVPRYKDDTLIVSGQCYIAELMERIMNATDGNVFSNTDPFEIVDKIVQGGAPVTNAYTSITTTSILQGTGAPIDRTFVGSAYDAVLECAMEDGCRFWVSGTKVFKYEPESTTLSGLSITLGTSPIKSFKVLDNGYDLFNKVYLSGAVVDGAQVSKIATDASSIGAFTQRDKIILNPHITDQNQADDLAAEYLAKHANGTNKLPSIVELTMPESGYETLIAGNTVSLTATDYGIATADYLVTNIIRNFPSQMMYLQLTRYDETLSGIIANLGRREILHETTIVDQDPVFDKTNGVIREALDYTSDFVIGCNQLNDETSGSFDNKIFFDVGKAALRAGTVESTEWDNSNLGTASVASGKNTKAAADYSNAGGHESSAYLKGQLAHAITKFTAVGDAQYSRIILHGQTTDAVQTEVFLDTSDRAILPAGRTWAFHILIAARQTAGTAGTVGDSGIYDIKGGIKRDGANNTALVGTIAKAIIAEDQAGWDVDVDADDTNESLRVRVLGETNKTIHWVATIHLSEVG